MGRIYIGGVTANDSPPKEPDIRRLSLGTHNTMLREARLALLKTK